MNSSAQSQLPEINSEFDMLLLREIIHDLHTTFSKSEFYKRLSDEQAEVVYFVGHTLFTQGKFEKALNVFKLILLYRPFDPRNLEAYATTLKRLGRFEEAIPVYVSALIFGELSSPSPSIHIAECLAALGRSDESEKMLRPILDLTELNSAYAGVRARAENLLSVLKTSAR